MFIKGLVFRVIICVHCDVDFYEKSVREFLLDTLIMCVCIIYIYIYLYVYIYISMYRVCG